MTRSNTIVRADPYRWHATNTRTAKQWRKWENVGLDATLDLTDLVLNWTSRKVIDLDARGAITAISLDRTIEGASTLQVTLRDPNQRLFSEWAGRTARPIQSRRQKRDPVEIDEGWEPILGPNLTGRAMEVHLDGAVFRLVGVNYQHQAEEATLTFEDRIAYLLRRKKGERRASRAKITRAQFILSLLREVKLTKPPFICPELSTKQPVDKPKKTNGNGSTRALPRSTTRALRSIPLNGGGAPPAPARAQTGAGIPGTNAQSDTGGDNLTVKGAKATPTQKRVGQQVLDTCSQAGADPRPTKACVCACIIESTMQNLEGGDKDSRGVLQIRDSTGQPMGVDNRNVTDSVTAFLKRGFTGKGGAIDIARKNPGMSVGRIAQAVQGSAYPDRYDQVADEAQKWIDAYGGEGGTDAGGGEYSKSYQYARESDENSWDAIQRLASEVNWRFFIVGEAVYYMSEAQLYRRRPRYEITAASPALLDLQYDVDWGKPVSECTMTVALDRWGAPPGAVMLLSGFGPPDGRWLVTSIRRDWFAPTAELTLKQPGKQKLEPASERATRATKASSATSEGSGETTGAWPGKFPATGPFGTQRPGHTHSGLDVGVPSGTDCTAPFDGTITLVQSSGFGVAGGMVHLQTEHRVAGLQPGDKVGWGHCVSPRVKVGDKVSAGKVVALSNGSPPHVHFVLLKKAGGSLGAGNGVDGNADPSAFLRRIGSI